MTERDEAEYVVRSHETSAQWQKLWRHSTNAQSRVLEETFMKSNIPYTMVGGQSSMTERKLKIYLVI